MRTIISKNKPAEACTLKDFVALQDQDELTYRNMSILRFQFGVEFAEDSVLDYYLNELKSICLELPITFEDKVKYRYAPDMLSYDCYGTTQLDWVILLCNGIIDPKDFDMSGTYIRAPKRSDLRKFLSRVFNAEGGWIDINRSELKKTKKEQINTERF